jgi:nucleoside-diphosphate-sugar epimerase
MEIAITGSSGPVGSALASSLAADGPELVRLVRPTPTGPGEAEWDIVAGTIDEGALQGVAGQVIGIDGGLAAVRSRA